jgi:opacity protein-like surface antigen
MTVLAAAAFACAPAMAGDISGFYAGVYGSGVVSSSAQSSIDLSVFGVSATSPFVAPTEIINNPDSPLSQTQLDKLQPVLDATPFASNIVDLEFLAEGTTNYGRSASFGGVVGYGFGNGVRVELDYGHSTSDADTMRITGGMLSVAQGQSDEQTGVWTWGGMSQPGPVSSETVPFGQATFLGAGARTTADFLLVNGWYDFDTGTKLTPYVGGGAGLAHLSTALGSSAMNFWGNCDCDAVFAPQAGFVPAAQIGAGFKVKLSDPLSLDLGYRLKFAAAPGGKASVKMDFDLDGDAALLVLDATQTGIYTQHTLTAGLTFAFN